MPQLLAVTFYESLAAASAANVISTSTHQMSLGRQGHDVHSPCPCCMMYMVFFSRVSGTLSALTLYTVPLGPTRSVLGPIGLACMFDKIDMSAWIES